MSKRKKLIFFSILAIVLSIISIAGSILVIVLAQTALG